MEDGVDALGDTRAAQVCDLLKGRNFATKAWTFESYTTDPVMWVLPEPAMYLEHAVFPLQQIALYLTPRNAVADFGHRLADTQHQHVAVAVCCRFLTAIYTVPTGMLFRRLPALGKYLASWLADAPAARGPGPSGTPALVRTKHTSACVLRPRTIR